MCCFISLKPRSSNLMTDPIKVGSNIGSAFQMWRSGFRHSDNIKVGLFTSQNHEFQSTLQSSLSGKL